MLDGELPRAARLLCAARSARVYRTNLVAPRAGTCCTCFTGTEGQILAQKVFRNALPPAVRSAHPTYLVAIDPQLLVDDEEQLLVVARRPQVLTLLALLGQKVQILTISAAAPQLTTFSRSATLASSAVSAGQAVFVLCTSKASKPSTSCAAETPAAAQRWLAAPFPSYSVYWLY